MESHIQEFKTFLGIDRDINQQFKLVDNNLFVLYNNKWIQLKLTKNNGSFYAKSTLKKYGRDFMRTVGLMPKYQSLSMDEIKAEMVYGYTNKESLDFEETPYTIGNFLKGYKLNLPTDQETEKILMFFLKKPNQKFNKY